MKKFFILLSVATTLFLSSCKDENAVNPEPTGVATISGNVLADFNLKNNTPTTTYDAVINTKLIVSISDENSTRYIDGTSKSDGTYSVEIPVGNVPLTVKITGVDVRNDLVGETTTKEIFFSETVTVTASKGGTYIRDIYYSFAD